MSDLNEFDRRKLIKQLFDSGQYSRPSEAAKYLEQFNIGRRTVYDWWKRLESGESIERKSGSGQTQRKLNPKKVRQIVKLASEKRKSQRKIASKFDIDHSYVHRLVKNQGLKYYKKVLAPKSTPEQKMRQEERLSLLVADEFKPNGKKDIVFDDESYFLVHDARNAQKFYVAKKRLEADENSRFKYQKKFEKKVLVWIAISKKGCSEPYFAPSNLAIKSSTYIEHCIEKRLVPFLEKNYPKGRYIFWPDLAAAHYANDTVSRMDELGINYLPKFKNPPNVPQLRPIERFWANLKTKVYEDEWSATSIKQLERRIKMKIKEFDIEDFTRLCEHARSKIAEAAARSPLSVIN
ncbi:uncharacterized protein LOC141856297 [Brevipalpus obovatus]|uniref:uncharacterized protein LOC141856297 n=1 Tax=Brevipalpus obovatus TaxID=246614 RepID=UPI003D9FA28D